MNEQDLPSDSDESDFEYKPSDDENCTVSEEDESGEEEGKIVPNEDGENAVENKNKMTRKPGAKRKIRKRKIIEERCENEKSSEEPQEKKLSMEEEKKKSEALWEDFLKDTGGRTASSSKSELSNIPVAESDKATNGKVDQSTTSKTDEKENKVTVTQIFEFAGEKIKVEKEVPVAASSEPVQGGPAGMRGTGRGRGRGRGGGMSTLSAFVGQLGKKNKLSMLEKSKLDWDSFKKEEGIEEDLKTFNKGKDGYLERQDFLQRADLRQFEIEKEMRAKKSGR